MERWMTYLRNEFQIRNRCRVLGCEKTLPAVVEWLMLGFIPAVGVALAILGFVCYFLCRADGSTVVGSLFAMAYLLVAAYFLLKCGWLFLTDACAVYTVSAAGVRVKYPLEKEKLYSWDDFQEVCICSVTYQRMKSEPAICFVIRGEKKNLFDQWKTENPFKFRKVMAFDFSEERLAQLRAYCPYPVPDYRGKESHRV